MLRLKQLIKSIVKFKTSFLLSLVSLVISFLGIIILTLYINYEKSFDQFHENKDNIYALTTKMYQYSVPEILTNILDKNIPEIKKSTVLHFLGKNKIYNVNSLNDFYSEECISASSSFFQMFSFPLVVGNKNNVLKEPNTAVISEDLAKKLFKDKTALNEIIVIKRDTFKVSGIMKDFPKTSSFSADCITSFATIHVEKLSMEERYSEWSYQIYIQLKDHVNPDIIASKILKLPDINENFESFIKNYGASNMFSLISLNDIHYDSQNLVIKTVNPVLLKILGILALVLAIMGLVNFINFSTSQAPLRAKSLSVKRVLGISKFSSAQQVIFESILLSLSALIVSFTIYAISYSSIESFFHIKGLALTGRNYFIFIYIASAIVFGVIAGIYPARYITTPPLSQTLKGNSYFKGKGNFIRNAMLTMQFIFVIGLLTSSFLIEKQLNYWNNFDLGFNKDHVVYLSTTSRIEDHADAFQKEILEDPNITESTYTQFIPGQVGMGWGREVDGKYIHLKAWPVDDNFINFFHLQITQGRSFIKGSEADINSFILNEKAVSTFNWDKPLEKKFPGIDFEGPIVGIVKNFNYASLKESIEPMLLWRTETRKSYLLLRTNTNNYTQLFKDIKAKAKSFDPKNDFEVKFLDDALNDLYAKEQNTARFIEFVSLWCMLLAITGVFGLVIFISRDRIKEIGIRKVNGAQINQVIYLFNKSFIKWIVTAFVIATPISWYLLHNWLQDFAYKTNMSWWIFGVSGLITIAISASIITWQSWKAATRNPVEVLRNE